MALKSKRTAIVKAAEYTASKGRRSDKKRSKQKKNPVPKYLRTKGDLARVLAYFVDQNHPSHVGVGMSGIVFSGGIKSSEFFIGEVFKGEQIYLKDRSKLGKAYNGEVAKHLILALNWDLEPTIKEIERILRDYVEAISVGCAWAATYHLSDDGTVDFHFLISNFTSRDTSRKRKSIIQDWYGGDLLRFQELEWEALLLDINRDRRLRNEPVLSVEVKPSADGSIQKADVPRIIFDLSRANSKDKLSRDLVMELLDRSGFEAKRRGKKSISIRPKTQKRWMRFNWLDLLSAVEELDEDKGKHEGGERLNESPAGKSSESRVKANALPDEKSSALSVGSHENKEDVYPDFRVSKEKESEDDSSFLER